MNKAMVMMVKLILFLFTVIDHVVLIIRLQGNPEVLKKNVV